MLCTIFSYLNLSVHTPECQCWWIVVAANIEERLANHGHSTLALTCLLAGDITITVYVAMAVALIVALTV